MLNERCAKIWFIMLSLLLAITYATFLLFQKDVKDFLIGKPLGIKTFISSKKQKSVSGEQPILETKNDQGGVFLILLFYYFQDAAIIEFTPIYAKSESELIKTAKKIIGGLFKFRLDVLHLAKSVCSFPDLLPVGKVFLKLSFLTLLFVILILFFLLTKRLALKGKRQNWKTLSEKASVAVIFSLLFSYQKMAGSCFKLAYCVPVLDKMMLFIDGNQECWASLWQIALMIYTATCIVPFCIYIALMPHVLSNGHIPLEFFFLGCIFPIPFSLYFMMKKSYPYSKKKTSPTVSICEKDTVVLSHSNAVFNVLQGPYREIYLPFTKVPYSWSGVLLFRRLLLIIMFTFVHDILVRLIIMLAICMIWLLLHIAVQPCKEPRANLAGTISCGALLIVALVNTIRACFESMEMVPTNNALKVSNWLDFVENCLLLWIPLTGIAVLVLLLILRLITKGYEFVERRKNKVNTVQIGVKHH